jgi:formate dehydrogenase subunit gamma
MEIFRVSRDVWGREMLQGMSWDLLWVFFGAGLALIVLHALYRALLARRPEDDTRER